MDRSEYPVQVIDEFKGINQLVDDLKLAPEYAPSIMGCYSEESTSLQRLKGKLQYPSTSTDGNMLVIQQLTFNNGNFLVLHAGATYKIATSLAALRVVVPASVNPLEPVIWWET